MGIFDGINLDWSYNGPSSVGSAIGDYMSNGVTQDESIIGNTISDYIGNNGLSYSGIDMSQKTNGGLPWSNIIGTLGKLGAGIGGFISAREANKTPYLVPTTQWLGNGLARTGYVDMSKIRQNKLDQATGATNAIGQAFELFGNRFGKNNNSDLSLIPNNGIYNTDNLYNDIYGNSNYGSIGNAIGNYMGL